MDCPFPSTLLELQLSKEDRTSAVAPPSIHKDLQEQNRFRYLNRHVTTSSRLQTEISESVKHTVQLLLVDHECDATLGRHDSSVGWSSNLRVSCPNTIYPMGTIKYSLLFRSYLERKKLNKIFTDFLLLSKSLIRCIHPTLASLSFLQCNCVVGCTLNMDAVPRVASQQQLAGKGMHKHTQTQLWIFPP